MNIIPERKPSAVQIAERFGLRKSGREYSGPCPRCGGDDRFHVKDDPQGEALFGCRGCGDDAAGLYAAVMGAGVSPPPAAPGVIIRAGESPDCTPVCADYEHPDGAVRPQHRHGEKGLNLVENRLYGLSGLGCFVRIWPAEDPVKPLRDVYIVCEGGKAARALQGAGFNAVSWYGGATGTFEREADYSPLIGKQVRIAPDNDAAGFKAAGIVRERLIELGFDAADILFLNPPGDAPVRWDVADVPPSERREFVTKWGPSLSLPQRAETPTPRRAVGSSSTYGDDAEGLAGIFTAMGIQTRLNVRTSGIEWRCGDDGLRLDMQLPEGWSGVTDEAETAVRAYIELHYQRQGINRVLRYGLATDRWQFLQLAIAQKVRHDPVLAWLDSLPDWDGRERLERLFIDALGAADNPVSRFAARGMLLGALHRTHDPGVVHDWIPVLVGAQGIGKSDLIRRLFPLEHRARMVNDNVSFGDRDKEKVEKIGNAVICEFAELQGLSSAAGARVKNYITLRADPARMAYGRHASDNLRRWVGIGTANDSGDGILPHDATGNRRYMVVPVAADVKSHSAASRAMARKMRAFMEQNRSQIWAEAKALWESLGETDHDDQVAAHLIPGEVFELQNETNELYAMGQLSAAPDYAEVTRRHLGGEALPLVDLMVELGLATDTESAAGDKGAMMRVAGELTARVWRKEQRTIDGRRVVVWIPPILKSQAPSPEQQAPAPELSPEDLAALRGLAQAAVKKRLTAANELASRRVAGGLCIVCGRSGAKEWADESTPDAPFMAACDAHFSDGSFNGDIRVVAVAPAPGPNQAAFDGIPRESGMNQH